MLIEAYYGVSRVFTSPFHCHHVTVSVRGTRPNSAPDHLPVLETPSVATRAVALSSIMAAVVLLCVHAVRLVRTDAGLSWWMVPLCIAGMVTADFLSGVVHWGADTWGSDTMPVLGKRLLRPFRVHHINPADFLTRHWIDTNGDVATIVSAVLAIAFLIPLDATAGQASLTFIVAIAATTLPTNQVHQWAHMPSPPRIVRAMQKSGLLLSHPQHAKHHAPPYVSNYCIALGWCNEALVRTQFFSRVERVITKLTGAVPREDEGHGAKAAEHQRTQWLCSSPKEQ